MSDSTPRLGLPDMPETPELYADKVTDAFSRIDAFTDLYLKGQFVNTPPASPSDGDAYLIGGSPTGDWSGYAYKIATCRDGAWSKLTPFNGLRAYVAATGAFIVYADGVWTDWNSLIGASESSIASATTCDIGAAGLLFLSITGTATITSLGAAANKLRFLRFAGALTLTHHATSLILPGSANIATAAGDTAIFASDTGGNWRCRAYSRADGRMVNMASPAFTGTMTAARAHLGGSLGIGVAAVTADNPALDIYGGGTLYTNSSSDDVRFGCNVYISGGTNIYKANAAATFYQQSGGAHIWRYAASGSAGAPVSFAEIMRTDTSGNLCIGTGASGYGHRVVVAGGAGQGILAATSATGNDCVGMWNAAASGNNIFCSFYTEGSITTRGGITYNRTGGVVAYNTTSDARLKTVTPQQHDYRNAIRALWVGDFTWTDGGAPGFGVLAQQAYEVMPNRQGVTPPADADGTWQASAEPFAHLALWGVKDIYALIETLSARIAMLEARHAG